MDIVSYVPSGAGNVARSPRTEFTHRSSYDALAAKKTCAHLLERADGSSGGRVARCRSTRWTLRAKLPKGWPTGDCLESGWQQHRVQRGGGGIGR
jgi:hypothetical protein